MKKSHERFRDIIREHFDTVGTVEFRARLHAASHGGLGEPASVPGPATVGTVVRNAVRRLKSSVASAAGRMLGLFH